MAVQELGKSPVISDGSVTLAESGAIVEYLAGKYGAGKLVPAEGTPERLRYTYWMHFAEGSMMPPLLLKLIFDRIENGPMPFFVRPIARSIAQRAKGVMVTPNLERLLSFIESELAAREWFAGPAFSAADIQMSFPMEAAAVRGGLDEKRAKSWGFLQKIHARPAYQRALDKGGKYELLR